MNPPVSCFALGCLVLSSLAPAARAEDGPAAARLEAIQATRAALEQDLDAHGGSWAAWAERLGPYRDDIRGFIEDWQTFRWPWPARDGYVFQGAAVRLHLMDSLDEVGVPEALIHFDRQLKARGIDLMVAIIPSKLAIYPDFPFAAVEDEPRRPARAPESLNVSLPVKRLMLALSEADVEVVDLHRAFADHRREHGQEKPLFYVRDSHYMNRGARLAAARIAERLERYDVVREAQARNPFVGEPGARTDGDKADPDLLRIRDREGQPYRDAPESPVLILGDSHLAYNEHDASISAQIAHLIGLPLSRIWAEGLSADIPVRVAQDRHLERRRVLIVHYTERTLVPRRDGSPWPIVDLPVPEEGGQAAVRGLPVEGWVAMVSDGPTPDAPYPHFLLSLHLTDLTFAGRPVGEGAGVVKVLAMHRRRRLPAADVEPGQRVRLRITDWDAMGSGYDAIQTAILPDANLEIAGPVYWGEFDDQPRLTAEDLARVGEEDAPEARAP